MHSPFRLVKEYVAFRLRRALNLAGLQAEADRISVELAANSREAIEARHGLEQAIDRLSGQLQRLGDDVGAARTEMAARLGEFRGQIATVAQSFAADMATARAEQRALATTLSKAITERGDELRAIDARAAASGIGLRRRLDEFQTALDRAMELSTDAAGRVEAMRAHVFHLDAAMGAVDAKLNGVRGDNADAAQSFAADLATTRSEQRSLAATLSEAIAAQGDELSVIGARAVRSSAELRNQLDLFQAALGHATELATDAAGRVEAVRAHVFHLDTTLGAVDAGLGEVRSEIAATAQSFAADINAVDVRATQNNTDLRERLDEFHAALGRATELASDAAGRVEGMRAHVFHLDTTLGAVDAKLRHTQTILEPDGTLFGFIRQGQMASPVPELTFVCSRGRTGTQWLTEALNQHPQILAAHGPSAPPVWFHGRSNNRLDLTEDTQWKARVGDLSLAQCRAEMMRAGSAVYYALVHALTVPEVADKLGKEPSSGKVATINIVRHPLPRINSFQAMWLNGDPEFYAPFHDHLLDLWQREPLLVRYRAQIERRFDIDLTDRRNVFFVMACYWLRHDQDDFKFPVRHFAYERLVTERDYMAEFLRSAFGASFVVSDEHLDAIARIGPRNVQAKKQKSPAEVFAAWEPWQKYCFNVVFEDIDLPQSYANFDYDFSFATARARRPVKRSPAQRPVN